MFSTGVWEELKKVKDPSLKQLAVQLPEMALSSRQDKTVRNYLAAFNKWKLWCKKFDEVEHLPAKAHYVALYLLEISKSCKSHAPVSLAYYAISWAHKSAGLNDPTKGDLPRMVKEAACRNLGHGNNKKDPVSVNAISKIVKSFANENSDLMELRISCICVLGFSAFLRFDELSKIKFCDLLFAKNYMKLFIEQSKTDVYRQGEWVYIAKLNSDNCPVRITKKYLRKAGFGGYSENYVFRGITRNKDKSKRTLKVSNKPICYSTVRSLILKAFKDVGEDVSNIGTHSLRKGGATAAARSSVEDRLFKRHGRWKSERSKDKYVTEDLKQKLFVTKNLGL